MRSLTLLEGTVKRLPVVLLGAVCELPKVVMVNYFVTLSAIGFG